MTSIPFGDARLFIFAVYDAYLFLEPFLKTLLSGVLVLLFASVTLVGCGEPEVKKFKVTGTVSFTKTPLSEGTITFEDSSTGVAEAFKIEPTGGYTAYVPEGSYGVSIQPPMITVADSAKSEGGDEFKKVDNIPPRYWSAFESNLKVSVSQDTVFDIDMVKVRK